MSDKPVLMALVGYFAPPFGLVKPPRIMTLERAYEFMPLTKPDDSTERGGFYVLIDPASQRDLAHWEMEQRSKGMLKRFWSPD